MQFLPSRIHFLIDLSPSAQRPSPDPVLRFHIRIPDLVKNIFIHQRIDIETFQCYSYAEDIVPAFFKQPADLEINIVNISCKHCISAEIAKIAPDVRFAVIILRPAPQLFEITIIVKQDQFVLRHRVQESLNPGVRPFLGRMIEHPRHLKPDSILIYRFNGFVYLFRHI